MHYQANSGRGAPFTWHENVTFSPAAAFISFIGTMKDGGSVKKNINVEDRNKWSDNKGKNIGHIYGLCYSSAHFTTKQIRALMHLLDQN